MKAPVFACMPNTFMWMLGILVIQWVEQGLAIQGFTMYTVRKGTLVHSLPKWGGVRKGIVFVV